MAATYHPTPIPAHRQRGAVLLIMLIVMVMGAVTILVTSLNSSALQNARGQTTAEALAKAKDALIGYAVANPSRPGALPCPDLITNIIGNVPNDGIADTPNVAGACPSYVGRLPWKTLGLPHLRDGSGEGLWYALSPNFRDDVTNPVNSNNLGTLQVYDNSGTNLLTGSGVAIIFAPGSVVGTQQRDAANQNAAQNYLDVGPAPSSIDNGNPTFPAGTFTAANRTSTFNDRLLIVGTSDIIPLIETRVAKDVADAFASYLASNGNQYPYPANFNACTAASCPGDSTTPTCVGKVPATDMALPPWFTPNKWFDVIYYSAGTNVLPGGAGGGGTGNKGKGKGGRGRGGLGGGGANPAPAGSGPGCYAATLTVSGTSVNALFFMPGTPLAGQSRTGANASLSAANLANFFEDAENISPLDNIYVIPGSTAPSSNDSLDAMP